MTQTTSNSNFSEDAIRKATEQPDFDQPVVLRQSPTLSRTIIWVILGVTVSTVAWAAIAKIEQVVTATGQLQPQGAVKEIQAPINGVVKEVFVEDGDKVKKDELLLTFDSDAAAASKKSLLAIQKSLTQENQLYRAILSNTANIQALQQQLIRIDLPPEVRALALNRLSLISETQVLRAQIGENNSPLSASQAARVSAAQRETQSRVMASQLELEQLQQRLAQTRSQLANARTQLTIDQQMLADIHDRNQQTLTQAKESLDIETKILNRVQNPELAGAIPALQIERQRQQVGDRQAQLIEQRSSGEIERKQQQQQIDNRRAEIDQLLREEQRLQLDIRQANAELTNAESSVERSQREQVDGAQQRLAAIDSELNKMIVENSKRLSEVESQLAQVNETLKYQGVTAPIAGTVFDLQASPRFVPRAGQAEPLLKIVPDDALVAEVFITNRDIGFVLERFQAKQKTTRPVSADIRIDSFPFSKFGDIEGEVISVGSDALPPDEIYPYYRFPVGISLEEQSLDGLPLQSGMSVSVNIKIQEKRSVLSLLTNLFNKRVDDFKRLR
ncbi:HlyD family efflux transporter periplasmic adaptor subunit [Picosynechococcus sp. PCC 8807]|uniref:HlyD family efflux transporter periplasmic adaptor subunit n=1 Tax=Picosynechococcus sp. PCC 8807 TaxID=195248 RepID=UPI000810EFEF|nr:HlyD family efflux transporter periplasmic adaptor subunit [Picosynechococcus sp. PCC 8807]ANV92149.1 hemolysin secretion protein D [Picosynechococcus sp. PCC 8807]